MVITLYHCFVTVINNLFGSVEWYRNFNAIQFYKYHYEIKMLPFIAQKIKIYLFNNVRPIISPIKVKDPISTATNTVSATDANGSPAMLTNIE